MHWLMITQQLNPQANALSFVLRWVEELAARLDHLTIICQGKADIALPPNVTVYSMGKEQHASRIQQAARLTTLLRQITPQVDGIFCHMIPRYVLFAAPWVKIYRKPLLLWYVHQAASPELRLAAPLVDRILTAVPESFPLKPPKVRALGHGIDIEQFEPGTYHEDNPPEIVMVARLAHIKNHARLIEAAPPGVKLVFIGGAVPNEPDYPAQLQQQAANRGIALELTGNLLQNQVIEWVRGCTLSINLSPPGLFDKGALESMALGKVTLVNSHAFDPLIAGLPLLAQPDLATQLRDLLALSPSQREAMGQTLRERVAAQHALPGLMDRLVGQMRELTR